MDPWSTITSAESGALTEESFRRAFAALKRQMHNPPPSCAHLHSYSHVKRLREQGVTEANCYWCGKLLRVS